MRNRKRLGLALAGWLILVSGLILAACGSPPTPASEPVATLRPTFTPVTPEQPTAENTPTAYSTATAVPDSDTPTPGSGTETAATPEPSALPAATKATGPMPKLSGTLFYPVFDTADQTYHIYRMDL
ncbi:MAG: hypothetical protein ACK2UA_16455, partial [Anaerolineae bacterium]